MAEGLFHSLFKITDKRRSERANFNLGLSLAFIAGAINAGGFMVMHQYTSHMTGLMSMVADNIALNHIGAAVIILVYIFCFVLGAMSTAFMVMWGRRRALHSQYALPLLLEAALLLCFGLISDRLIAIDPDIYASVVISLLCFLMGLQNAVITKVSATSIRTTHITGMTTDIGIELGKILYLRNRELEYVQVNRKKLFLHVSIVSTFLAGGVVGAFAFIQFGGVAALPLAVYLIAISLPSIIRDLNIGASMIRHHHKFRRRP